MSVTTADRAARRGCTDTTGPPGSFRLLCVGCRQNFATVEQRDKDVMLRNFFGSAVQPSGGVIMD